MALIQCPDCGREVSDEAISCPKCARPIAGNLEAHNEGAGAVKTPREELLAQVEDLKRRSKPKPATDSEAQQAKNVGVGCLVLLAIVVILSLLSGDDDGDNNSEPRPSSGRRIAPVSSVPVPASIVPAVAQHFDHGNKLGVGPRKLRAIKNPKSAGYLVHTTYIPHGRKPVWLVFDAAEIYALNSPSKTITPTAPWPRESPDGADAVYERAGLKGTSEAVAIVYGADR